MRRVKEFAAVVLALAATTIRVAGGAGPVSTAASTDAPAPTAKAAVAAGSGLITSANLVYQGAFRLPYNVTDGIISLNADGSKKNDFDTFAFGGHGIGFNPARNSLFVTNFNQSVAEIGIPQPSLSANLNQLPQATVLQGLTNSAFEGKWNLVDGDRFSGGVQLGSVFPMNGTLVSPAYTGYDSIGGQTKAFLVRDTQTLAGTGHTTGPFTMDGPPQASGTNRGQVGYVDGYIADIPLAWQAALGGPHAIGNAALSIISRTSAGPSLFATDLAQVTGDPNTVRPSAQPLVYYPLTSFASTSHPLLDPGQLAPGACSESENQYRATTTVFNCAAAIKGVVIPTVGHSALFFGSIGTGPGCYGIGTSDPSLQWQRDTVAQRDYCYDPQNVGTSGNHAYPYVYYVWAYDLNDLAAVKAGTKAPWAIRPYATWSFAPPILPPSSISVTLSGAAYDPATQTIYLVQHHADSNFNGYPLILAYKIVPSPDAPAGLTATVASKTQVALNWSGVAGAVHYSVKRSAGTSGSETVLKTGLNATSFTDTVSQGQTYYYVVTATNTVAEGAASSEAVATIPPDADAPPGIVVAPYQTTAAGRSVRLAASVAGYPPPVLAWQMSTTNGASWTDVAGGGSCSGSCASTLTLTATPSLNRAQFRVTATNKLSAVTSTPTTLVVRVAGADVDGDNQDDLAVFRPSSATWFTANSATGLGNSTARQFGQAGDVPVPGDYDGDGRVDLAVWRRAPRIATEAPTGRWEISLTSTSSSTSTVYQPGVAAPRGTLPVPGDYDGDGKTDIAQFDPTIGVWSVFLSSRSNPTVFTVPTTFGLASLATSGRYDSGAGVPAGASLSIYRPSTGAWWREAQSVTAAGIVVAPSAGVQLGAPTDIPVPGDYDGDGFTDIATYAPATGMWNIRSGTAGSGLVDSTKQWGLAGDTPVPGDYDGDGRTDIAVYRPGNGVWYLLQSSANFTSFVSIQWGLPSDVPVPGDYDGDGITDLAVYRPSTGVWYVLKSSTNFTASLTVQWGLAGDITVPGDYDGDGKTDMAVYRPSTATWFILKSSTGLTGSVSYQYGVLGDIPAPADYDGDGRTDVALWRPSTAVWYILYSSTGFTSSAGIGWGVPGDVPILGRQ